MSDEIAESHSLPLLRGSAGEVASAKHKQYRSSAPAALFGVGIALVKAIMSWGWLGAIGVFGIGVITVSTFRVWRS